MMRQLYDILAVLCLPSLLAVALLLRALHRSRATAAVRADAQRQRIEALRAARTALERSSCTDPLTGVWNYRYLQLSLDREIARCLRQPRPPGGSGGTGGQLALLLLEIEGFEEIRREHGYQRAGAVLRDLAQRLAMEFREADIFGRYGGEEFLVLLPDTDATGAQHAAERLCWAVRRHSLLLPAVPAESAAAAPAHPGNGLSAVVGVASLPPDGAHAALLLRAAERALALARTSGRPAEEGPESPLNTRETPTSHRVHRQSASSRERSRKSQGQV
jgi:diguanylate cyclase (GGDEF)-like protein